MNIQTRKTSKTQGSVLMTSLLTGFTIGITLASYLIMVQQQNTSVFRSQTWNTSITLSEAGVEDALQHLNSDNGINGLFATDGWTDLSGGIYQTTRTVGEGYYVSTITVAINSTPMITSEGYYPFQFASASMSAPMFAAVGVNTSAKFLSRKVQVQTKKDALLNAPMAAKQSIDLSGNNVETDSFDSVDPAYSTNGRYDASKRKAGGDVVTNSSLTNSLNIGNANILGTVRTGPRGLPGIGPNGVVGDLAWVNGGNKGIQTGHFADDMNVVWPDVKLPNTGFTIAQPANGGDGTNINGIFYRYYLTTGNWQINNVNEGIYVDGNVTLYVPSGGSFKYTGSSEQIYIAPDAPYSPPSHSMTLYVGTSSAQMGGLGVVNATGNAINFMYYGLPSNKSLTFSGNSAFVGTIYAPNAAFTLGGGGSTDLDFVGASVSNTVKMNGHFKFHYDENLRRVGPGRGYIATSWKEI